MTIQKFLDSGIQFFNLCTVYYVIQLVRCATISFIVFGLVFFLRKTVLKNTIFLKAAIWGLFIPVLFMGKMKFFYENKIGIKIFSWCTKICMDRIWLCWLYVCFLFVYAIFLSDKRRKLKKLVAGMEKRKIDSTVIYVTKVSVTPFTIGVFRPKIVMPEIILESYQIKEIQTILLHEKIHIQLGHLLFYYLWDILQVLLWINPLLRIGTKLFREDIEEICDLVTIRRSKERAYTYGQLLLKSMRILQTESEKFNMFATFIEDREYQNIQRRIKKIVQYRPYKRITVVNTLVATMICVMGIITWIQNISYHRYNENDNIFTYGYDGKDITFFNNSDVLHQMISYDDNYVYIDREAFENFLYTNNAAGEIFIVFGGFYKLPGFVGIGYSCFYRSESEDKIVLIPYEKPIENWMMTLIKIL